MAKDLEGIDAVFITNYYDGPTEFIGFYNHKMVYAIIAWDSEEGDQEYRYDVYELNEEQFLEAVGKRPNKLELVHIGQVGENSVDFKKATY